jgi:hypothetical protein
MTTDFRDPALWLLIELISGGIAHIVAFVLLDQDLIKHDRAEESIEAELAAVYERLGHTLPTSDPARVKNADNYAGRIVASILTCGIYTLWWGVDQQRDADRHFDQNWPWEDALVDAIQRLGT